MKAGLQGLDWAHSDVASGTAACGAKQLFREGVRFGDLMPRLLGDAAACDQLFQTVAEAAVEIADKLGEAEQK